MPKRRPTSPGPPSPHSHLTNPSPVPKRPRPPSDLCPVPPAPFYDFADLLRRDADLRNHAKPGPDGKLVAINFSSPAATLALSKAILAAHFDLTLHLPPRHLVPTVPNRVQYLRWAASLLPDDASNAPHVLLDLGTGPSAIYAMLAARLYPKWHVLAVDTDATAVASARVNVRNNALHRVTVIHNTDTADADATETAAETEIANVNANARVTCMFPAAVRAAHPTITVCNPPFHAEVPRHARRGGAPPGTDAQLATYGGELAFVHRLAVESSTLPSVAWFTSLVGRKTDVSKIAACLRGEAVRATHVRTAELRTGGRTVRWAVAWSFGLRDPRVALLSPGCGARTAAAAAAAAASRWRATLAVWPGRVFANQLAESDVSDLVAVALVQRGWDERTGTTEPPTSRAVGERMFERGKVSSPASLLSIAVLQEAVGELHVSVKVVESGDLKGDDVAQLFDHLAADVELMLRESTVGVD